MIINNDLFLLVINTLYPSLKGIGMFSSCLNNLMDLMLLDLDCACSKFQAYCEQGVCHIVALPFTLKST